MLKQVVVLMPPTLQLLYMQEQPSRGVLMKRCSENMQQIYRRTPMPKFDLNKIASNFIEITLQHGFSTAACFRNVFS